MRWYELNAVVATLSGALVSCTDGDGDPQSTGSPTKRARWPAYWLSLCAFAGCAGGSNAADGSIDPATGEPSAGPDASLGPDGAGTRVDGSSGPSAHDAEPGSNGGELEAGAAGRDAASADGADGGFVAADSGSNEDAGQVGAEAGHTDTPGVCANTYTNPLIWQDLPDLEVIRVEDAYYYTASSFHHAPGAPLLRSYDLVHWEYVSHSVPVLDMHASYDLNGSRSYVNGIWASSLQYRKSNQTFYWMGCMHNLGGGWVFTAKTPEGPWEKHKGACYYDMGLLVDDDDKLYVAHGNNTIRVAQLSADGFSEVKSQVVLDTPASVGGPLEGSRFYKKDGIYYILMTQYANGEWVIRSKGGPFGPYEGPRPLAVRLPYAGTAGSGASPHQGGIVGTQNGQWYYVGFNDAYPAGRIPVMIPVTWSDGWPSVQLVNGQFGGSYPFPNLPCGVNKVRAPGSVERFQGPTLAPEWEWNHNPDNSKWSLDSGLILKTANVTNDLYAARNTLTRRIEGPTSSATIELDYSKMKSGDVAGLAALRDQSAWIGVKQGASGARVVTTSGINMNSNWQTSSIGNEGAGADISGGKIWLRVEADIRTNAGGGQARFSYSVDGAQFKPLGNALSMNKNWQYFLGYRFGIFHYATQALGGEAKIVSFTVNKP